MMPRDVNPQFLRFQLQLSAANTFTVSEIITPVLISHTGKNVEVMEVLKVFVDALFDTLAEDAFMSFAIGTIERSSIPNFTDAGVFARFTTEMQLITSGATLGENPKCIDLTDGAGNGYLVASSKLFLHGSSAGQAGASLFQGAILYRMKSIPTSEYVGIVQSQIGG